MKEDFVRINTVEELTTLMGIPSKGHPLIRVVRLSEMKAMPVIDRPLQVNLYVIALKEGCPNRTLYGWREYDFSKGQMNFFAPGQIHLVTDAAGSADVADGCMLVFHPDFLRRYPLASDIRKYRFFSYEVSEALHTSDEERQTVARIIDNIASECERNIDDHSQHIIVAHIDVLLGYAERFYTRQFRTRYCVETDVVTRFEDLLAAHFAQPDGQLVSASDVAAQMSMSTGYLNDLLRSLTGMNTQQHIHARLIEHAKNLLLTTSRPVGEIAYSLGFEYPQYFSRLFKNKTGQTPSEFRTRHRTDQFQNP